MKCLTCTYFFLKKAWIKKITKIQLSLTSYQNTAQTGRPLQMLLCAQVIFLAIRKSQRFSGQFSQVIVKLESNLPVANDGPPIWAAQSFSESQNLVKLLILVLFYSNFPMDTQRRRREESDIRPIWKVFWHLDFFLILLFYSRSLSFFFSTGEASRWVGRIVEIKGSNTATSGRKTCSDMLWNSDWCKASS